MEAQTSNDIQPRTRNKAPPSFPRERQQQPPSSAYYHPQQYPSTQLGDFDAWRLQTLHSTPVPSPVSNGRVSRGPRTTSPVRSINGQQGFTWESTTGFQQAYHRRKSVISNASSSDHHALLHSPHQSRSPSPGGPHNSGSPRTIRTSSVVRDTKRGNTRKMPTTNGTTNGCRFETALVNSRRRIPYSVGSDKLAPVTPGSYAAQLDEKEERCLTVDIMEMYQVLFS
jgi:hypothetical protein